MTNYEIKMPANYAAIDAEEMTYLVGGETTGWNSEMLFYPSAYATDIDGDGTVEIFVCGDWASAAAGSARRMVNRNMHSVFIVITSVFRRRERAKSSSGRKNARAAAGPSARVC